LMSCKSLVRDRPLSEDELNQHHPRTMVSLRAPGVKTGRGPNRQLCLSAWALTSRWTCARTEQSLPVSGQSVNLGKFSVVAVGARRNSAGCQSIHSHQAIVLWTRNSSLGPTIGQSTAY
jgi:hypothetical protein